MDDARTAFAGIRALVTGGGSGIGLAIARRLAGMGAALTLVGRERGKLERALRDLPGDAHDAMTCDVGDRAVRDDDWDRADQRAVDDERHRTDERDEAQPNH